MTFILQNFRFLSFGLVLCYGSTFGQTYFFGAFQAPISEAYGLTPGGFGLLYLGVTLLGAVGLTSFGSVIDRVPLPAYTIGLWLATALFAVFFFAAGALWTFAVAMFCARLTGQGLMVHAAMTSMSRYFPLGRGRAVAVAGIGMTLGQALLPAAALMLMTVADWRQTYLLLAVGTAAVGLPLSLWLLKGHSARHQAWLATQSALGESGQDIGPSLRRADMLRDIRFYAVLLAVTAPPFWLTAFFFFALQVSDHLGLSLDHYVSLYWVYALVAGLIPVLAGGFVDVEGGKKLLVLPPALIGLAALSLIVLSGLPGAIIFLLLLGIAGGMNLPINNALWAELYGTRYLGEIKATTNAVVVLSTALAPFLLGQGFDGGLTLGQISLAAMLWVGLSIPLARTALRRSPH